MRIYLDNNATTPIHPEVLDALATACREVYGNASSIHKEGQAARRALEESRDAIAQMIGAGSREVVFTSGGTESNNAALFGAAGAAPAHIITTSIEHPSVLEPLAELERRGWTVTRAGCDSSGRVSAADVVAALRPDTKLVSLMLVNNETGVVQPVAEVAAECRRRGIAVHCDAVQAAGKLQIDVEELGVDVLAISAHKMHAPKGIGALYVRSGTVLQRILLGGAQERRRRAGTENVPLAVAFATAAAVIGRDAGAIERMRTMRDGFEQAVCASIDDCVVNGAGAERVAGTSSLLFRGSDAEGIVIGLDLREIAISTGAACSSGRVEPSHVLFAMGLSEADARSSVRISMSRLTTSEELDRAAEVLRTVVASNRR
jgi:cysteine desulfurase